MDKNTKAALIEGSKKGLCVASNAAMFFFLPDWVFGDTSWFPADPVWAHITITMLCELDTMDRLNEKILLRTAGTTLGAVCGILMSFSGLGDIQRLVIIMLLISTLGYIEKKDPARSYTWTIATVTFGICTFLGRMGKPWTPWKRWFSIVLGTIVTSFWQLLLPYLGVLPRRIIRDELGANAKAAWNGCMAMLEDASQNPGDAEAAKRLGQQQAEVHGFCSKWPAAWKQYSYARNWLNLQPKKALPMDGLRGLLKGPLFNLFLSSSAAARMIHSGEGTKAEEYAAFRAEVHKVTLSVSSVIPVVATKHISDEERASAVEKVDAADAAIINAKSKLEGLPSVQQALLAAALQDIGKVITHLQTTLSPNGSGGSTPKRGSVTKLEHRSSKIGKFSS